MEDIKLPILFNGEKLAEPITKKSGPVKKKYPRSYNEAKENILNNIESLKAQVKRISDKYIIQEFIFCVRMAPGFKAKSYYPSIIHKNRNIKNVGAKNYYIKTEKEPVKSKLYFMRSNMNELTKFEKTLADDCYIENENACKQIRSVEIINFLSRKEKQLSFVNDWEEGRVEIVLHPFDRYEKNAINKFEKLLNANNCFDWKLKAYENGPIFVSAKINRKVLNDIVKFNALRTVHPIKGIEVPSLRNVTLSKAPFPPNDDVKSTVKIGVFDGGADTDIPLLQNYVNNIDLIKSQPNQKCVGHGSAVCGSILYGPLNDYNDKSKLEVPNVSVESFRVLPTIDPNDFDLYEVIDEVERIVPNREDISIYNLSLGPCYPILDDQITRFTYSLDKLAYEEDVLFCVAVGNYGAKDWPLNRIQPPSDLVNGLGIGSYTYDNDRNKIYAEYSCIGIGREGCKIKPDLCAFGGSANYPFQVVSTVPNKKGLSAGTSFSSPVVAGIAGSLVANSKDITPQIARSLLIHTAEHPAKEPDHEKLGHGFIQNTVNDILNCQQNRITVLYTGELMPRKFVRLPIPLSDIGDYNGNITISWTITVLSHPNAQDSDGYTSVCIEDVFYPHAYKYTLKNDKLRPKNKTIDIKKDSDLYNELIKKGYIPAQFPNTDSGNKYKTEEERRNKFKWDTVVKRWKRKRGTSLKDPFLTMHAMGRNGNESKSIKYATVVTIDAPKYKGNLYDNIINTYSVLQPLRLRNRNEVMIST